MMNHSVKNYGRSALEDYIMTWFSKKMSKRNAHRLANELGHLINSAGYGYGDTIEERAMFRETGTRIAEYIIGTLYDDPEDRKKFMDGIIDYARHDILREKGALVQSNIESISNARILSKDACIS